MTLEQLKTKLEGLLGTLLNEIENLDLGITSLTLDKITLVFDETQQVVYELSTTVFFTENDNLVITIRKIL